MAIVKQQFVRVGEREVFLRYAGKGPALVLLHQSPQNSRALLPWIERLAPHYAVFAPDTPGFGYSDPLPIAEPTVADFAAALESLLNCLALERVLIYGVHTGAVTAMRLALDYPHRVVGLVGDGYARFNREEREDLIANYLPPFEPKWDGTHLLHAWQRLREQHFFFPWHASNLGARLGYPIPSIATTHANVLDLLDAGDGYRAGYRAPFMYDDPSAAARLRVPTHILYRAEDVLAAHIGRLPTLPAQVKVTKIDGDASDLARAADGFFASHAANSAHADTAASVDAARSSNRYLAPTGLGLRVVKGATQSALVRLVLNEIGHPSRLPVTFDTAGATIVIDLPGHGASREWLADDCAAEPLLDALIASLAPWPTERVEVFADGGSCVFGALVAKALGGRCERLVLRDAFAPSERVRQQFLRSLPDLRPSADGTHLLAAWNWARTNALFSAWAEPLLGGTPPSDALRVPIHTMAPAPRRVHAQVVEMLRAGDCFAALWRTALAHSLPQLLQALPTKIELHTEEGTDAATHTGSLAAQMNNPPLFARAGQAAGQLIWESRS